MSVPSNPSGAFPLTGPVTYLNVTMHEAEAALRTGPYGPVTTWFHATYERFLPAVLQNGLAPACWRGQDTCAVFGYDNLDEVPSWRHDNWIIEVVSEAIPGQAKAWWVPPSAIRGAWHKGVFHTRDALATLEGFIDPPMQAGCACELSRLVEEQQRAWRASHR